MAWWEWGCFPFEQPINNFYDKNYTDTNTDSFSSIQYIIVLTPIMPWGPHRECVGHCLQGVHNQILCIFIEHLNLIKHYKICLRNMLETISTVLTSESSLH